MKFWLSLGLVAQLLFSARFVVQWLASERAGRSVVPLAFWYLSLSGSTLLLLYAIHRRDPVFILGQGTGVLIYLRNLYLIYRPASRSEPQETCPDHTDSGQSSEPHSERKDSD